MKTNQKKSKKCVLALALAAATACGMLPHPALAADTDRVYVSDEAGLKAALAGASKDAAHPTQIIVRQDITVNYKQLVEAGTYVSISSEGSHTIQAGRKFADSQLNPAAAILVEGTLSLSSVTISGGNETRAVAVYDGVLELNKGAILTGGRISSQMNGGGLYVADNTRTEKKATATINEGASISGNAFRPATSVEAKGIGLYIDQASVVMNGGSISDNVDENTPTERSRTASGGAIGINGNTGIFTMNGGTISGNLAKGNGGAVYLTNKGQFVMKGGTISGNTCYGNGGALYLTESGAGGSSFVMTGGSITGNTADATDSAPDTETSCIGNGGALYLEKNTSARIEGGSISGNRAVGLPIADTNNLDGGQGGGIYTCGALQMTGGSITKNQAVAAKMKGYKTGNGGGISVAGGAAPGTAQISGGSIQNNTASAKGADLYLNAERGASTAMQGGGPLLFTEAQGRLVLSGKPKIGNIYLPKATYLYIGGPISGSGLSVETAERTSGTLVAEGSDYSITAADARALYDDNGKHIYNLKNGKIVRDKEQSYTDLSAAVIESIADRTYTGSPICPEPKVTLNGKKLTAGEDYQYGYEANTDAGTARLTVVGAGKYDGSVSAAFRILPADLSRAVMDPPHTCLYEGSALTPDVHLLYEGLELVQNTDYSLSYEGNGAAGTARVTATGKGNYQGSLSGNFSILNRSEASVCTSPDALQAAISRAKGTEEAPDLIFVAGSVQISETLQIPSGKYIHLIGASKGAAILGRVLSEDQGESDDPILSRTAGIGKSSMIRVAKGASLTVSDLRLLAEGYSNKTSMRQRVLRVDPEGRLNLLAGAVVEGGFGYVGAGVYNCGDMTVNGAVFKNNRLTGMLNGYGGAITNHSGSLTILAGSFQDNFSRKGGAIANMGSGSLTIEGGSFTGNSVTGDSATSVVIKGEGGAIYNGSEAQVHILGGSFRGNQAEHAGGAIASYGSFTMDGGTIRDNSTDQLGGGIYSAGSSRMNGGSIVSNTAKSASLLSEIADGGGLYVAAGQFALSDGEIKNNAAISTYNSLTYHASAGNGGGVYVENAKEGASFVMHGGLIQGNQASAYLDDGMMGYGGGIYAAGGSGRAAARDRKPASLTIDGGTIRQNSASGKGAGIYAADTFAVQDEESRTIYDDHISGPVSLGLGGSLVIADNEKDNLCLAAQVVGSVSSALTGRILLTAEKGSDAVILKGKDYRLSEADANVLVNEAGVRALTLQASDNSILLKGKSIASGYTIEAKKDVFTGRTDRYSYTGKNVCPSITVRGKDKTVLKQGRDYTVEYLTAAGSSRTAAVTEAGDSPYQILVTGCGEYGGSLKQTYTVVPADLSLVTVKLPDQKYTGKAISYVPNLGDVTYGGKALSRNKDYYVVAGSYKNNVKAGTASFVIEGSRDHNQTSGNFSGRRTVTFRIIGPGSAGTAGGKKAVKAKQPMKVTGKTVTVKYKALKKKKQLVKPITVKKAQGKLTYKKVSGAKQLSVNKKTGKITVKKGSKKKTYTIKVKVTAAGNASYQAGSKTISLKVRVK